jgi:uncharacterized protein
MSADRNALISARNHMTTLEEVLRKYQANPEFLRVQLLHASQKGAMDSIPLHIASRTGAVDDIDVLVLHGADINAPGDLANTPLHEAVMAGKHESAKRLIELGAAISLQNEFGQTPLDVARIGKHSKLVTLLLNWGPPRKLDTALHGRNCRPGQKPNRR